MIGQVAPFSFNSQNKGLSGQKVSFKQNPANKSLVAVSKAVDEFVPSVIDKNTNSVFNKSPQYLSQRLGFSQEFNSFEGVW